MAGNDVDNSSLYLGQVRQPPSLEEPMSILIPGERVTETTTNPRGFPPGVLLKNNDKFLCYLCDQLLREPVQNRCGHRFCKYCLMNVAPGTKCKQCASEEEDEELTTPFYPDPAVRREINKQDSRCINPGCDWTGLFKNYLSHSEECDHKTVVCECGAEIPKQDLETHKSDTCSHRKLACKYCADDVIARDLGEHLNAVCREYEVECAETCGMKVRRSQMEAHADPRTGDCANRACPFPGCAEKGGRDHAAQSAWVHCSILLQLILGLRNDVRGDKDGGASENKPQVDAIENRLAEIETKVSDTRRKIDESRARVSQLPAAPPPRSAPPGKTSARSEVAVAAAAGVCVLPEFPAADAVSYNPSGELKSMKQKQEVIEGLSAVLNREVEKIIHDQTNLEHQRSTNAASIDQLKGQVSSLERSLALKDIALAEQELRLKDLETTSFDGKLMWAIDNFSRRRQEAINGRSPSVYSTSFYTSRAGYKMCIRIYLNGDGMGKGTHISLFFVIMKGQYDAILPWPFKQKVTMTLRDQNNREHVIDAFRPDPSSSSFRRPQSNMNIASGVPLFCPLSKLEDRRYSYVKDDTMFLSINVDLNGL